MFYKLQILFDNLACYNIINDYYSNIDNSKIETQFNDLSKYVIDNIYEIIEDTKDFNLTVVDYILNDVYFNITKVYYTPAEMLLEFHEFY
jgi:hypothetical protein